jgi:GT2 family glycosyltransferase
VAVVNYNGARYLERTLRALDGLGPPRGEILLVDNGSTDSGVALALRLLPRIRVRELGLNRGPAVARNVGLQASATRRVLLVDNDVMVQPGCIEALNAALDAHPRAAIAMPAVRYASRPEVVQYAGADAHFLGSSALLSANVPLESLDGAIRVVTSGITACILVDRERLGEHAELDESYFMYFEDHELGLRASLLGFDVLAVPRAQCLHAEGTVGLSIRETGRFTPERVRRTIRNRWFVLLKLYQARTLLRFAPAFAAFELAQLGGAVYKGWLLHWLWAAGSLIASLPDLLRRRRAFQRARVRPDLDVLVAGPFPTNEAMHRGPLGRGVQNAFDAFANLNWRIARGGEKLARPVARTDAPPDARTDARPDARTGAGARIDRSVR